MAESQQSNLMFTFLLLLTTHVAFLVGGIWIGYKNAKSSKVEKAKTLLEEISGK